MGETGEARQIFLFREILGEEVAEDWEARISVSWSSAAAGPLMDVSVMLDGDRHELFFLFG